MGSHTWRVENFSQIDERKRYSEEFEIDTYTWRLLLFPRGNDNQRTADYVAAYLDYPEAPFTPAQICPKAHFELTAVNQNREEESVKREANHVFTNQATDWGFTQFLRREDALNNRSGFVVNDTLVLTVRINVQRDDHLHRLSREQTGFVGLKNRESTSYMNSLLQYLYHIRYFRKAVYQMPTQGTDDPEKSIPLALQSLFYKLQYQNSSVSPKCLMKACGWGVSDTLLERDMQEMHGTLCEKLENKLKGTEAENSISELFLGHYSNYVEYLNMNYTSSRKQPFSEIQLDVLGCKDIYESLHRFCGKWRVEGQTRPDAENVGVQAARRFARFESFPPVMQFHLKRFDNDPSRDQKSYVRYEFYDELDLDCNDRAFLSETSDRNVVNKYRLHSILVRHGSHYSAFIKSDGKWYKFNDDLVKKEAPERAISVQSGTGKRILTYVFTSEGESDNRSSAYMLVYIRLSDWDRIMCECGKGDISEPIRTRFEVEQAEKEKRHREKQDAHLHVVIKLATEKHFKEQIGKTYHFDLANFDEVATYRLHKKTRFEDFKKRVCQDFGIPTHLQRFWLWMHRQNGTVRIDKPLESMRDRIETVLDLRHYNEKLITPIPEKNALMTIQLFLEAPEQDNTLHTLKPNEIPIFIKFYDPQIRKLSYVGHLFVDKSEQFKLIFERARILAKLSPEADVMGFEELKHEPNVVCPELLPTQTPEMSQLVRGDIIIIQERVSDAQMVLDENYYPTAKSFLEFLREGGRR